jgi:hypothetical protein
MADADDDLPVKSHDGAVAEWCKMLINSIVKESEDAHGDTPRERLKNQIKHRSDERMVGAITALSTYVAARAAERQAMAMESLAKTANKWQMAETVDTNAQAMVDQREPRRDYLATTYSLPTETLALLWSIRGMLMDASVKSLSRPDRFDPYRRLTTEEIAWSLRTSPDELWSALPRIPSNEIDFPLLEEFDIIHYGGTPEQPDDWMYGG